MLLVNSFSRIEYIRMHIEDRLAITRPVVQSNALNDNIIYKSVMEQKVFDECTEEIGRNTEVRNYNVLSCKISV